MSRHSCEWVWLTVLLLVTIVKSVGIMMYFPAHEVSVECSGCGQRHSTVTLKATEGRGTVSEAGAFLRGAWAPPSKIFCKFDSCL